MNKVKSIILILIISLGNHLFAKEINFSKITDIMTLNQYETINPIKSIKRQLELAIDKNMTEDILKKASGHIKSIDDLAEIINAFEKHPLQDVSSSIEKAERKVILDLYSSFFQENFMRVYNQKKSHETSEVLNLLRNSLKMEFFVSILNKELEKINDPSRLLQLVTESENVRFFRDFDFYKTFYKELFINSEEKFYKLAPSKREIEKFKELKVYAKKQYPKTIKKKILGIRSSAFLCQRLLINIVSP